MNYYVFAYVISIILSLVSWWLLFKKYRNLSGLFFFLFTFFVSVWFLLYFLFFSGIDDTRILLFLSRLNFWIGLWATYSLLFFIYFFDTKVSKIWSKKLFFIIVWYLLALVLHAFTNLIIDSLVYVEAEKVYREVQGKWYLLNGVLHITGIFLFILAARWQLKKQTYLNNIRLKRILYSAYAFMVSCLILQLILPTFWIWILEKEIIFLFVSFILYTHYTIKRYYFSSLWYGIGKIFVAYLSLILSIVAINLVEFLYFHFKTGPINNYWLFQDQYSLINTLVGISVFSLSYGWLHRMFLGNSLIAELKNKIQKLERGISYINNLKDLDTFLQNEIKKIFKISYCELKIFPKGGKKTELQRYFENDLSDKIFINDVVFTEKKKTKFDKNRLFQEIPEQTFLILPFFNGKGKNIGVFILGAKAFGDFYTVEEIEVLRGLMSILELHLKYIETYELLRELSVNLDKKVDEKTMEYNNLINKQKEFISIISHEIKTPITTAIFQADSIIDDLGEKTFTKEDIRTELQGLSAELIKTGELLSKIFSVQYFDTHKVTLFREKVKISHLLETEYDIYSRMHEGIRFINRIDGKMGFVEIDRIQFQQVIANLLNNATKFASPQNPTIIIEAHKENDWIHISIEDNGKWFDGIDIERLFEKYSVGNSGSAWLGMGLYLCKKIIDMHNGEITASVSENLSGAKFSVKIPAH